MTPGDLEFTGEQIFEICRKLAIIPGEKDTSDALAEAINDVLRERLEKAPIARSHCEGSQWHTESTESGDLTFIDGEFARLVCVEEKK